MGDRIGEFVMWSGKHNDYDHPPDTAECEVMKAVASPWKHARDEPNVPAFMLCNIFSISNNRQLRLSYSYDFQNVSSVKIFHV